MTDVVITPAQWRALMDAIALDGVHVPVALKRFGISPSAFRRLLRAGPQLHAHFVRAKKYAKRRRWPELVVLEIFEDLARTDLTLKEAVLRRGYSLRDYRNFNAMCFRKPEWRTMYLTARSAKVTRRRTQLLDVSDDQLVSMGRRGISKAAFAVHSLRPMPERRAAAKQYRTARAGQDPIYAARQRAAQTAKKVR